MVSVKIERLAWAGKPAWGNSWGNVSTILRETPATTRFIGCQYLRQRHGCRVGKSGNIFFHFRISSELPSALIVAD
jgi:hypothetical protein